MRAVRIVKASDSEFKICLFERVIAYFYSNEMATKYAEWLDKLPENYIPESIWHKGIDFNFDRILGEWIIYKHSAEAGLIIELKITLPTLRSLRVSN